jgi:hypothetical protein
MALGNVTRWSVFPVVVCFALAQGCGSGDDDSSSGGCTKDTDCINGRVCESGKCTDVGAVIGGSSGSAGTSGGSTAKGGSGGQGGSGGSSGTSGTSGQGGSSSGSGGTGGTSGTAGMCSDSDPVTCPTADSMTLCVDGALETDTCDSFCTGIGFPTGPCMEPDGCECDFNTMTDATCTDVMNTYCSCLDFTTSPCTNTPDTTDPNYVALYPPFIYAICHQNVSEDATFLRCLHDAMPTTLATCQTAFTNCAPAM